MQVEFAYAASLAAAVAPCFARFGGGARTGRCAASRTAVHHAGAVVRSGHDDENGKTRSFWAHAAKSTGITAVRAVMADARTGMQIAYACTGASAVSAAEALAGSGPKKGVMTHDACMGGRRAARDCFAAPMTGS